MGTPPHTPDISALEEQHPIALLAGLFVGFASVILTFGFLSAVRPAVPRWGRSLASVLPFKNHWLVARGAFYACLGVVCRPPR